METRKIFQVGKGPESYKAEEEWAKVSVWSTKDEQEVPRMEAPQKGVGEKPEACY